MNANELADELEERFAPYCDEAATMLRQQQAEIEALKRGNEATALLNYNKGYEDGTRVNIPFVPNPMPNPIPHTRS